MSDELSAVVKNPISDGFEPGTAQEEDVGAAIGNAIADYRTKSGKAIWGMSIMIDKARQLPDSHATA